LPPTPDPDPSQSLKLSDYVKLFGATNSISDYKCHETSKFYIYLWTVFELVGNVGDFIPRLSTMALPQPHRGTSVPRPPMQCAVLTLLPDPGYATDAPDNFSTLVLYKLLAYLLINSC